MGQKSRVAWLKNRVNELGDFNQAWAELLLFFEAEYKAVKEYNKESRELLGQAKDLMEKIDDRLDRIEKALGVCEESEKNESPGPISKKE